MDLASRLSLEKALELGLVSPGEEGAQGGSSETTDQRVFDQLLRHRKTDVFDVETFFSSGGSAHDRAVSVDRKACLLALSYVGNLK